MTTSKTPPTVFRMGTWSDSFLSSFQFWVSCIAIVGTALGLLSAVATLLARQESGVRQSTKESQRTARIQAAEAALESTKERLSEARTEAKSARELATKAETASKPRRLTDEQKALLAESLMAIDAKPKIFMCAGVFDPESVAFGEDIERSLVGAGFEVRFPKGLDDSSSLVVSPTGLHIVLKDPTAPNPTARKIQKCFIAAGINLLAIHSEEEDFPADRIEIAVGPR